MKKLLLFLLVVLPLVACSNKPTEPEPAPETNSGIVEKAIGPDGGTISTDEFVMEIPSGAFLSTENLKLAIEKQEQAFGEASVTPLFRLEGMPTETFAPIQIKLKYTGTLSEVHNIAIGVPDSVELNDSTFTDIFYTYYDATESDSFLTCEIPALTADNNILIKPQIDRNLIDFFIGGLTGNDLKNWNPFSDHFTIKGLGTVPENERGNADEIMSILEQTFIRFQNANFDYTDLNIPIDVTFSTKFSETYPCLPMIIANPKRSLFEICYPTASQSGVSIQVTDSFRWMVQYMFLQYILKKNHFYVDEIRVMISAAGATKYGYSILKSEKIQTAIENCATQFLQLNYQYILFDYLVKLQGDHVLSTFCNKFVLSVNQLISILEAAGPPEEWLVGYYVYLTAFEEFYNITGADFWEGKCTQSLAWDTMNETEELSHAYPDLGAAWYNIKLSSNMTENTSLKLLVNSTQADIAVLKYNASEIEYIDNTSIGQSQLIIPDLKNIADAGYDLLVIVCNHNATPAMTKGQGMSVDNADITLSLEKMEKKIVTNCSIHIKDIHVSTIIHYESGDQPGDRYHFMHIYSDPDFTSSFANGVFYQSYQTKEEDGTIKDFTMEVKFNEDLSKILNFTVELSRIHEDENPLYSYADYKKLTGANIDLDPSGLNSFAATGTQVCDKITGIETTVISGTQNWELNDIIECVEQTDLKININE